MTQYMAQNSTSQQLTFACLDALVPRVIKLCVAGISTVLEPSTIASATTEFAGFLGSTALGTPAAAAAYRG